MPYSARTVAQDAQRPDGRLGQLVRLRRAVGVVELGEDHRVDPLGVRRPLDAPCELRPDVLDERVAHARELAQVAVVGEDDAGAGEVERVQVRVGDDGLARVGHAADVGDRQVGAILAAIRRRLRSNEGSVVAR